MAPTGPAVTSGAAIGLRVKLEMADFAPMRRELPAAVRENERRCGIDRVRDRDSLGGPVIQPVGARTPSPGISGGGLGRGFFRSSFKWPPPSLPRKYRGRGKSITA